MPGAAHCEPVSTFGLEHLVHEYGLVLIFAAAAAQALGAPVPGTTVVVLGALYAADQHGLPIAGVIAAGALGATLGTCGGFAIGRWRGEQLLAVIGRRLRQSPERVQRLRAAFAARGASVLFVGRFVSGLRNVLGLVAGASAMSFRRFAVVSAAAATAWSLISGLQYYWFGRALEAADTWLQIVLICLGLAWFVVTFRLMRRAVVRATEHETLEPRPPSSIGRAPHL